MCVERILVPFSAECKCVNGTCNEGVHGDGSCLCHHGWKGALCNECKLFFNLLQTT